MAHGKDRGNDGKKKRKKKEKQAVEIEKGLLHPRAFGHDAPTGTRTS